MAYHQVFLEVTMELKLEPDGPSLAREVAQAKPGGALKRGRRDTT